MWRLHRWWRVGKTWFFADEDTYDGDSKLHKWWRAGKAWFNRGVTRRLRRWWVVGTTWLENVSAENPVALAFFIFLVAFVFVVGITLRLYGYDSDFLRNILVEAHGMLFDLLVIGFVILWLNRLGERRQTIKRHQEEVEDYLGWQSDEAMYRIVGNIRRLNRDGVTHINLSNAYLVRAKLRGADLRGADLRGADLRGADLQQAKLQRAKLSLAKLDGANLWGADLREAKLDGTHLQEAELWGANLREAGLFLASLQGAKLRKAKLEGADLRMARLQGADLQEAGLRGANLQGADLQGARLWGADLWEANLQEVELKTVVWDETPDIEIEPFALDEIDTQAVQDDVQEEPG